MQLAGRKIMSGATPASRSGVATRAIKLYTNPGSRGKIPEWWEKTHNLGVFMWSECHPFTLDERMWTHQQYAAAVTPVKQVMFSDEQNFTANRITISTASTPVQTAQSKSHHGKDELPPWSASSFTCCPADHLLVTTAFRIVEGTERRHWSVQQWVGGITSLLDHK